MLAGFARHDTRHAVFPSIVGWSVLTCQLLCWTVWSRQFRELWRLHRSSSRPGCGCACRCATTGAWFDGAETVVVLQFSSKVVDFPFVPLRHLPMVPPFRKTIDAPVMHVVLDMPIVVQRQVAQVVQQTFWRYRMCSTFAFVDVAVISQRQSRLCREVPQTRSSTGCSSADIFVRNRGVGMVAAMRGDFAAVLQHFSASVHLDVETQGGGDAGSLTPGRSVTPIRCNYWRVSTKTFVKSSVRTTTTSPPPSSPSSPPLPHPKKKKTHTPPPPHPTPPHPTPPPSPLTHTHHHHQRLTQTG